MLDILDEHISISSPPHSYVLYPEVFRKRLLWMHSRLSKGLAQMTFVGLCILRSIMSFSFKEMRGRRSPDYSIQIC